MKKIAILLLLLVGIVTLSACTNSNESKTYDGAFIKSLAKGLDARWKFIDNDKSDSASSFKKAINKELDEISEYKDKKFKDSKLQELAISYINELNNGLEIAKTYGSDSFETKWDEHIGKRTSLLSAIDKINSIPVQDKDSLSELLAQGNEVKDNNAKKEAIENLVKNINFTVDNTKSNEYTKYYSATVENTTEYLIKDIYLTINLVNADGVTVGTQYVSANNWAPSGKTLFEFSQFKGDNEFTTTQVSISSFNAKKTE